MVKSIFHDGLQKQLQDIAVSDLIRNIDLIFHDIAVSGLLDLKISFDMLLLLTERDPVGTGRQTDPEKVAQGACQPDDFFRLPGFGFPHDGIKCIVEEMRIDLGLQGAQLRLPQSFCILFAFFHHGFKTIRHGIDLLCQVSKLHDLRIRDPCIKCSVCQDCRYLLEFIDRLPDQGCRGFHGSGSDHHGKNHDEHLGDCRDECGEPQAHTHLCCRGDLKRDIFVQHAVDQSRHIPDFGKHRFIVHYGNLICNIIPDLINIVLQRFHGPSRNNEGKSVLLTCLLRDLSDDFLYFHDHFVNIALRKCFLAAYNIPGSLRDLF